MSRRSYFELLFRKAFKPYFTLLVGENDPYGDMVFFMFWNQLNHRGANEDLF